MLAFSATSWSHEASYLNDDDPVFGVDINGDARAYPLRIANWHEMVNDVVGGVPVSLAYCTLCGAGILFDGRVPGARSSLHLRLFRASLSLEQADVRSADGLAVEFSSRAIRWWGRSPVPRSSFACCRWC